MIPTFAGAEPRFLYSYRAGDDKGSSSMNSIWAEVVADRPPRRGLKVAIGGAGEIIFPRLDATVERRFRRALRRGPIALNAEPGELARRFGAESDDHIRLEIARLLKSGIAQRCRDGRYVCLFDALA